MCLTFWRSKYVMSCKRSEEAVYWLLLWSCYKLSAFKIPYQVTSCTSLKGHLRQFFYGPQPVISLEQSSLYVCLFPWFLTYFHSLPLIGKAWGQIEAHLCGSLFPWYLKNAGKSTVMFIFPALRISQGSGSLADLHPALHLHAVSYIHWVQ